MLKSLSNRNVGIITFHCQYNCGSVLQTYALQEAIKECGFSCTILNYYCKKDMHHYYVRWNNSFRIIAFDILTLPRKMIQYKKFKNFHKCYYDNLSKCTTDLKELRTISDDCSRLVCGSDQIWNMKIDDSFSAYFLSFATPEQRKISYAPSTNSEVIENQYIDQFVAALKDFTYISVRDEKIASQLSDLLNRDVQCVLDPTLLHKSLFWDNLIQNYQRITLPTKYIFVYCLGRVSLTGLIKTAEEFAKANNAEIVYYYKTNVHVSSPSKNIFCNGPLAFIYAIKNANYVIGDSFHACAFAILYNKQFAYNLNSTRINELMKKLNIKNRLIGVDWSVNEQVDYKKVNRLLDIYRKDSMGFLRKALLK